MEITKEIIYKPITDFLEANNFEKYDEYKYHNKKCDVTIVTDVDFPHFIVRDNNKENIEKGEYWCSDRINIYSLIGYLTYYGLMNKRYKQLNRV